MCHWHSSVYFDKFFSLLDRYVWIVVMRNSFLYRLSYFLLGGSLLPKNVYIILTNYRLQILGFEKSVFMKQPYTNLL